MNRQAARFCPQRPQTGWMPRQHSGYSLRSGPIAAGLPRQSQVAVILLAMLMLLIGGRHIQAQGLMDSSGVVDITAQWSAPAARAGDQRVLAVVLEMQDHYHINPDASQIEPELGFLIPTQVTIKQAAKGLTVGAVQYPVAQDVLVRYAGDPRTLKAYEGRIALYVPVLVESSVQPGDYPLSLSVQFQSCDEYRCLMPATQTIQASLEVVSLETPIGEPADAALFSAFDYAAFSQMAEPGHAANLVRLDLFGLNWQLDAATKLGYILLLATAALGGMLLNFTPCVLPVIPLKIMGLSQAAGNRARCLALGVAMSAGVVAFWMVLGAILALVSGFTAINQLFQYPAFTVGVGVVIAVMAVGMCGLFAIPLPRAVYQLNPSHDTYHGSFGFGIMTAVLSTPCTAPVMGMAAAWAATQHPATTLMTFGAIGGGMALPYLVLSAMPQLVSRMPRTGPASEVIKQVMGLLMLGAATFFIGVGLSGWLVEPPQPPSTVYWWGVMACIAAAGGWLVWRTFRITSAAGKRVVFGSLGLLLIVGSIYTGGQLTQKAPIDWVYYTPEQFEQAQQRGDVVVLEFTAEWCLNCKAMEQAVLYDQRVVETLRQPGVTPIKVDLTGNNPLGNAKLAAVGRVAIPLLVVFSPDGREVFKSDAYTIDQVVGAVDQALGRL